MTENQLYVSESEMGALAATAWLGNFSAEDLVTTAAWAFAQQDETFKQHHTRERCLRDPARQRATRPRRRTLKETLHELVRRVYSLFG